MSTQNKKRLLLTGISGSIGVHCLAHILHNTDWELVGLDSFAHKGFSDRLHEVVKDHPDWNNRWSVITHDLSAPISQKTINKIGKIDYVINMASLSDVWDSIQDPVPFVKNNVALSLNMLEYARAVKPEAFIQISTDETVGPTEEGQRHSEWDPILPSNPYSSSKACQEAITTAYWRTYNVPVIITNTVNNFGEMQSPAKFPVIAQKKIAAGEKVIIHGKEGDVGSRYYLHSRNFADALIFLLKNVSPHLHEEGTVDRPDKFNITSEEQIDNLQFAQTIAQIMDKELIYEFQDSATTRPGHDKHYGLDGTKLRDLGWKQPLSFEESLKNTVQWQQEHPEWIS